MKIFFSANSPYARIARVAAHTCGVAFEPICLKPDELRRPDNPILEYNCTGRVPTLVDGDTIVTETEAVCRYLEAIGDGTKIFTYTGDWETRRIESTAVSFLDGCALWTREYRRPEEQQSDWLCGVERDRAIRCLDWFNMLPGIVNNDTPWNFAYLYLTVAIAYHELRGLVPEWRDGRQALADWHVGQCEHPSMKAHPIIPGA